MSTVARLPYGGHYKTLAGVTGYKDVQWHQSQEIRARMLLASRMNAMIAITGQPGVGKSFMVARGAEACAADPPRATEVTWVEMAHTSTPKSLLRDLYIQITGTDPLRGATTTELSAELTRVLAERHRLLVVDEAQHVRKDALKILRYLYNEATDFALVIVGTPEAYTKLSPEMHSRVEAHIGVQPISDAEAPALLIDYHEMFATADPSVLMTLNKHHARGRFRWWAQFLALALTLYPNSGEPGLTESYCDLIAADMTSGAR